MKGIMKQLRWIYYAVWCKWCLNLWKPLLPNKTKNKIIKSNSYHSFLFQYNFK